MKSGVLIFVCSLIAAVSGASAQDLNRLELGTHDLAEMKTLTGVTLVFDPTKIMMVYSLPRSAGRAGSITNIIGLAGGPQEVDEPADPLLERLTLNPYFIALTFPAGALVWDKAPPVFFTRPVQPGAHPRSKPRTAVNAGGR